MSDQAILNRVLSKFPYILGPVILIHLFVLFFTWAPLSQKKNSVAELRKNPLKILTLGKKSAKSNNSVFIEPQKAPPKTSKTLNLSDLAAISPSKISRPPEKSMRPGSRPVHTTALNGLRYDSEDFKKMARDSSSSTTQNLLNSKKMALNFELPEGKKLDELNESELKLYGFLRRGAMKYVASLSSELKEFELKNPHLHFPLTESKQILTGRLVYDGQGNLKQIKMVRWTNIDKLQSFFENVLKRMDTLQNPPKELWLENGEFTVFISLQLNG